MRDLNDDPKAPLRVNERKWVALLDKEMELPEAERNPYSIKRYQASLDMTRELIATLKLEVNPMDLCIKVLDDGRFALARGSRVVKEFNSFKDAKLAQLKAATEYKNKFVRRGD